MASCKTVVLFSFLLYLVVVNAQRCTPGKVSNVGITSDQELSWSEALNPSNCSITGYVVDIFDPEDGSQLQFQTSFLFYNLSFLEMCKTYSIEVHAITDVNVLGPADRVNATNPPTATLDLTLAVKTPTLLLDDQVSLNWDLVNTGVTKCVSYYRVVYWDENNSPTDVYVPTTNFVLPETLVPCMDYMFQVNAIIDNPDTEGPLAETSFPGNPAATKGPKLVNIVAGKTTANMTWQVPAYSENRCKLTALVLDTLGLPVGNQSHFVLIEDSPLRPNVDVYLTGLTSDTVYTSRVSLQNTAGSSKNVTVTFQTSDSFVFNYKRDVAYD